MVPSFSCPFGVFHTFFLVPFIPLSVPYAVVVDTLLSSELILLYAVALDTLLSSELPL